MRTPSKKRTGFGSRRRIIRDGEACKPLAWARSAKCEARNPRPAPACQDSHRLLAACGGSVPVGSPQSAYSSFLTEKRKETINGNDAGEDGSGREEEMSRTSLVARIPFVLPAMIAVWLAAAAGPLSTRN